MLNCKMGWKVYPIIYGLVIKLIKCIQFNIKFQINLDYHFFLLISNKKHFKNQINLNSFRGLKKKRKKSEKSLEIEN